MEDIKDIKVGPMPESQFLKPLRMTLTQNGNARFWDFVKIHDSVACLLYNSKREVFLFVRQFRPAVFFGNSVPVTGNNSVPSVDWSTMSPKNGIAIELCAGIVDQGNLPLAEVTKKEVLEECGYDVPLENFEKVKTYQSGIGVSGGRTTLFYAEITDEMKVHDGGGLEHEGELIDVVEMTIPDVKKYLEQDTVLSPAGMLFAVTWFLMNKAPKT